MRPKFGWLDICVIAMILGVVAWAIYPVLWRYWYSAHKIHDGSCLNNARQIEVSVSMYVQDHKGVFPPAERWIQCLVKDYGVTGRVWDCPTTTKFMGSEKHPEYFFFAGPGTFLSGVHLEDLKDPATVPLLADLKDAKHNLPYVDSAKEDVAQIIFRVDCRHNGVAVFAYVDGHIEWLKVERVADPKTYQECIVKKPAEEKRK
ncbi:MAG: hypothetical protein ACYC7E_14015 [Armatimonadota bacterium]